MITDTDILAGIRDVGHGMPAWAAAELDDPAPSTSDIADGMQAHFGVKFAAGELDTITTVRTLVELLRRKFNED